MARRASSQSSPFATIGILAAVAVALAVGFLFINKPKASYTEPDFPVSSFMSNGNSLRGNTYSLIGTVQAIQSRDDGKFIHLRVDDNGREEHIPVIVPRDLDNTNIEREQEYAFKIEIDKGGIPTAREVKRT